MAIFLRPSRTRWLAPRWPYAIRREHPVARDLQGLIVCGPGVPVDLAKGATITRTGTVNIQATKSGALGFETTDAATGAVGYPVPTTWNNGLTWTFFLQKTGAAYSGSSWIVDSSPVLHLRTAATTYYLDYDFRVSSHTGAKDVDDGEVHIWTSVVREPTTANNAYELYIDGVHQSTNNPGLQGALDCSSTLYLANSSAGTRACGWSIPYWMAHERDLKADVVQQLHEDPWGWAEEYGRKVYFLPAAAGGGGGFLAEPTLATFGYTGFATDAADHTTFDPTQDDFGSATFAADVAAHTAFDPAQASFGYTGFAQDVADHTSLVPTQDAFGSAPQDVTYTVSTGTLFEPIQAAFGYVANAVTTHSAYHVVANLATSAMAGLAVAYTVVGDLTLTLVGYLKRDLVNDLVGTLARYFEDDP